MTKQPLARFSLLVILACCLCCGPALARGGDHHDPTQPADEDKAPPSVAENLPPPLSEPAVARDALAARGFEFGLKYIGEVFSNTSGGLHRGTIYEGKLRFAVDADLYKAFGLAGLTFHANASQLHGHGIDQCNTGAIMPVSNIEATPTTRLFEMWVQQSLLDDKINVRLGQLGADQELMTRNWAKIFINNSFGWPALTIVDLPSGGPAFPLSNLGLRVTINPSDYLSLLAAVFNGDPAGPQGRFDSPDPQVRNPISSFVLASAR
jgi:porin